MDQLDFWEVDVDLRNMKDHMLIFSRAYQENSQLTRFQDS